MIVIRAVHKLSHWLDKLGEYICLVMLFAMVIVTGAQIICRVFFEALSWSEELARYLLVWASLIGASCVYKHAGHISVTIVQNLLPRMGKKVLQLAVHVLCAAFFALMVYFGFIYMVKMSSQLSPAMRLPMSLMYASIPVGGVLMLLHALDAALQLLFVGDPADKAPEKTVEKEVESV